MKATPFLMFQGEAKPALALYREAFPDYEELLLQEHSSGPQQGQIAMARIRVGGLEVMLYDSAPIHSFSFTPSTSTFVECDSEAQLRTLAKKLADGGKVLDRKSTRLNSSHVKISYAVFCLKKKKKKKKKKKHIIKEKENKKRKQKQSI